MFLMIWLCHLALHISGLVDATSPNIFPCWKMHKLIKQTTNWKGELMIRWTNRNERKTERKKERKKPYLHSFGYIWEIFKRCAAMVCDEWRWRSPLFNYLTELHNSNLFVLYFLWLPAVFESKDSENRAWARCWRAICGCECMCVVLHILGYFDVRRFVWPFNSIFSREKLAFEKLLCEQPWNCWSKFNSCSYRSHFSWQVCWLCQCTPHSLLIIF